jgi:ATP-dependent Clp protease protease subunit
MFVSEIDEYIARRALRILHLLQLDTKEQKKPITIKLHSQGGDWFSGMAIYDALKALKCKVTIEVYGCAMSMGSIILQAGTERVLMPDSTIMVHDGSMGMYGESRTTEAWAEWSKTVSRPTMYKIYAERTGKPVECWSEKCRTDLILTADQAVAEGLADRVAR